VTHRGFDEADARARIARQSSREDRLKLATHVIDNSGDLDALVPQVDALWAELQALPQLPRDWDFPKPEPKPERVADHEMGT
jgi:dephospho-CoA kinase